MYARGKIFNGSSSGAFAKLAVRIRTESSGLQVDWIGRRLFWVEEVRL